MYRYLREEEFHFSRAANNSDDVFNGEASHSNIVNQFNQKVYNWKRRIKIFA